MFTGNRRSARRRRVDPARGAESGAGRAPGRRHRPPRRGDAARRQHRGGRRLPDHRRVATAGHFAADLGPETLALTTLGSLEPGSRVHLERPLKVGDPLGGHLVQGHVDIMGTVVARRPAGASLELDISAPSQVSRFLAAKGSVAVDGVSLTVNTVDRRRVLGDADPAHARGHQAGRQEASATPSTSRPT